MIRAAISSKIKARIASTCDYSKAGAGLVSSARPTPCWMTDNRASSAMLELEIVARVGSVAAWQTCAKKCHGVSSNPHPLAFALDSHERPKRPKLPKRADQNRIPRSFDALFRSSHAAIPRFLLSRHSWFTSSPRLKSKQRGMTCPVSLKRIAYLCAAM